MEDLAFAWFSKGCLWGSWSISSLNSYTSYKECEQRSSEEPLFYFLTDFIYVQQGIQAEVLCGAAGLFPYYVIHF